VRAAQSAAVRITLVAVEPDESGGPRPSDAFGAQEIRLVTYAGAGTWTPWAAEPESTDDRG